MVIHSLAVIVADRNLDWAITLLSAATVEAILTEIASPCGLISLLKILNIAAVPEFDKGALIKQLSIFTVPALFVLAVVEAPELTKLQKLQFNADEAPDTDQKPMPVVAKFPLQQNKLIIAPPVDVKEIPVLFEQ